MTSREKKNHELLLGTLSQSIIFPDRLEESETDTSNMPFLKPFWRCPLGVIFLHRLGENESRHFGQVAFLYKKYRFW